MPLRQLHRPLLRSVAAAWRPATIPTLSLLHGDSSSPQPPDHQQKAPAPAPTKPKSSLFERLFPHEAKKSQAKTKTASDADTTRSAWVSQLFDEPPRVALPEELRQDEESSPSSSPEPNSLAPRATSMLILSAASKHLLESDFMRLGVRGKHVDGWVGGIVKVIQARNPDTLEPRGHYFILFDSYEAAMVYKGKLEHLWQLGKRYIPGAHHARRHQSQQPLPAGLRFTDQGEDVAQLLRAFTLVPPSQRLHVQLAHVSPARLAELDAEGGFVDRLAARAGSRFLVLIRVDGGRLKLDTLRRAIEDDGVQRNLAWRVTDLENGILPFGKSIVKTQDQTFVDLTGQRTHTDSFGQRQRDEGSDTQATSSRAAAMDRAEEYGQKYRQYPRFIIPFTDNAEAHRFVRDWHRRELTLLMGGGASDQPSWEERRVINATVLW
ncbi:hypothetical protein F5Y19DRAFT_7006 [Xylariaceae sp. FL1651]|nr:hypothetical protein F5Y19DRAFT_7006 [Xylariaceae sp. FL1651]